MAHYSGLVGLEGDTLSSSLPFITETTERLPDDWQHFPLDPELYPVKPTNSEASTVIEDSVVTFFAGQAVLNHTQHTFRFNNSPIELDPAEFNLLTELGIRAGRVVPSRVLLETVWGVSARKGAMTECVGTIRRKTAGGIIQNVYGHGYFTPR